MCHALRVCVQMAALHAQSCLEGEPVSRQWDDVHIRLQLHGINAQRDPISLPWNRVVLCR